MVSLSLTHSGGLGEHKEKKRKEEEEAISRCTGPLTLKRKKKKGGRRRREGEGGSALVMVGLEYGDGVIHSVKRDGEGGLEGKRLHKGP